MKVSFPPAPLSLRVRPTADGRANGEVLAGELPSGKARLVQAWIELHRDELQADWDLAVNGEEVFKIDPLR